MEYIQILMPVRFETKTSKSSGKPYRAAQVQGILHRDDASQSVFALLLMAPYGEQGTDLEAGNYSDVTELRVDSRDRMNLKREIVAFRPVKVSAPALPLKAA